MKNILEWWYMQSFECKFHYCCHIFGNDSNVYSLTDNQIEIIYNQYNKN